MPPVVDQLMAFKFDDQGLIQDATLVIDTLFWNHFDYMAMDGKCAEAQARAGGGKAMSAPPPTNIFHAADYVPSEEKLDWTATQKTNLKTILYYQNLLFKPNT